MFQIEEGIPIPAKARGRKPIDFPLKDMRPGDSFLIESSDDKKVVAAWKRKVSGARRRYRLDVEKFKTVAVEGGLRVWRVE